MLDLFPSGFEERDEGDEVELAGYTTAAGDGELREALGPVESRDVDGGWAEGWKRFHRPVRIGPLWLGPPWERADPEATAVVVDPGQAFGTGAHATTRASLELLLAVEPASLVDLGCGSGVLAIAAAKLGFQPVLALDHDAAAVAAARANAAANGVPVVVRRADVLADALPAVEIGVANITLAALERLAPRFGGRLLVASGYLAEERPLTPGWRSIERRERDGWGADLLERF
jgi:ribosomal protein L11 methyltransferase